MKRTLAVCLFGAYGIGALLGQRATNDMYAQPSPISPPQGCAVVEHFEDGSAVAQCEDGAVYALDPDGREAGPWGEAHEVGQWYEVK
jgi:hypothetical protein